MAHVHFTSAIYLIKSPFFLIKDYCLRGENILNLYPQSMQIKSFDRGGKLKWQLFQAAEV